VKPKLDVRTSKYEQNVHTADTNIVANMPVISPEHWKACGMAKMPVPSDALSKWVNVSPSLEHNNEKTYEFISSGGER